MKRGLQLCAQDVYQDVPRSIHNHLPARNPTAQTAFWPFWKFSVLLISRGGEMILNSICNMKTISYFDWEPCFQQNNVFFWISLHKWWGRSFFSCKLMDSNSWYRGVWWKVFFQSWSAFSDQLSCNPWWWRSSALLFFQSNIGFKLHKNAKLSQTVLKSGIVWNWFVLKTRDQLFIMLCWIGHSLWSRASIRKGTSKIEKLFLAVYWPKNLADGLFSQTLFPLTPITR